MSIDIDTEPVVIKVAASVDAPVNDIPAPEWADTRARLLAMEHQELGDHDDVDTSGASSGDTLVFDGDTWNAEPLDVGIGVDSNGIEPSIPNTTALSFRYGIKAPEHPTNPGMAVVQPNYGTTANTIAEGNHSHGIWLKRSFPFLETGALSSGTRTLVTASVTGLDPTVLYAISAHLVGDVQGGGSGAGYSLPRITLNGSNRDRFGRVRSVAGVPREYSLDHPGVSVTGVSSITVSATLAYSEGDPITVGAGDLVISIEGDR